MSKSKPVFTFFLSLLIPLFANLISPLFSFAETEETLTITTYYPAPYGVYNEMRLFPHTPASSCDSTKIGTMYYDSAPSENQIKVCTDEGWKNIGGGGGSGWVEVTSDTNLFDTTCEYKWVPTNGSYNQNYFYAALVQPNRIIMSWSENETAIVFSNNKTIGGDSSVNALIGVPIRTYKRC